ncbi:thioesterase family protein [Wenjunlia tyrosinilytica]|uniref:Fluoroacetyl-CoA-specific thioesterase-like domain-containing protein n=1 Tax=Wenjunlia tyrosinilytica TaxID=1544741 RepID=A0A918DWY4_9ACTN|nr:thioesterase [Wenjunlia tyrosinilytica]GGO85641.1 hypothetical protein GCM10012280_19890 [Wenjunlia tyrosinilytica]
MSVRTGLRATVDITVTEDDTAVALGSGDVAVLATPRLLAVMEAATVEAVRGALDASRTTVGTRVQVEHLQATAVGRTVAVTAELTSVDGRLMRFAVVAQDHETRRLVATGEITRVAVDRRRFLARL